MQSPNIAESSGSDRMPNQEEFDRFVENYNNDYLFVLTRAASGSYDCLITSCLILKDLYEVIIKLHDLDNVGFNVVPYPFTLRPGEDLLKQFGFNKEQVHNIYGFLSFVKTNQGKELEECLEEGALSICQRVLG
ncbi:MAG TPA: hypothetical protein VFC63_17215 [Blastocatellia bacterium]|nr:hypothetical protein [Blastocatellia bacterium]